VTWAAVGGLKVKVTDELEYVIPAEFTVTFAVELMTNESEVVCKEAFEDEFCNDSVPLAYNEEFTDELPFKIKALEYKPLLTDELPFMIKELEYNVVLTVVLV
jgi:hypothetical protein